MEGERGVIQSIIDELHSWDIHGDQKEGESGVTRNIIDDHHSSDIERDQMESESGINRSVIDELHSSGILGIWKEIKWKVKVILLEVSLLTFFFRISEEIKW